jgi:hypothetical protein
VEGEVCVCGSALAGIPGSAPVKPSALSTQVDATPKAMMIRSPIESPFHFAIEHSGKTQLIRT